MAISQRLVDPYREIKVPTSYSWQESYQAALLETDWTKMQERVQRAFSSRSPRRSIACTSSPIRTGTGRSAQPWEQCAEAHSCGHWN
jgi:hypothetical protein